MKRCLKVFILDCLAHITSKLVIFSCFVHIFIEYRFKQVIVAGAQEHELPKEYVHFLMAFEDNKFKGKVKHQLRAIQHLNRSNEDQI